MLPKTYRVSLPGGRYRLILLVEGDGVVSIRPSTWAMPLTGASRMLADAPGEAPGVTVMWTMFSSTLKAEEGAANQLCRSPASQPVPKDGPVK